MSRGLGNWFNFIAALGLVRTVSHAAPEVTTILLIARLIPFTFFAPIAGVIVDRWSRRAVMIASDLLRVLAQPGDLVCAGRSKAGAVVVVCDGVSLSRVPGRAHGRSGNVDDAAGSR